jgi:hypothetical protein
MVQRTRELGVVKRCRFGGIGGNRAVGVRNRRRDFLHFSCKLTPLSPESNELENQNDYDDHADDVKDVVHRSTFARGTFSACVG